MQSTHAAGTFGAPARGCAALDAAGAGDTVDDADGVGSGAGAADGAIDATGTGVAGDAGDAGDAGGSPHDASGRTSRRAGVRTLRA